MAMLKGTGPKDLEVLVKAAGATGIANVTIEMQQNRWRIYYASAMYVAYSSTAGGLSGVFTLMGIVIMVSDYDKFFTARGAACLIYTIGCFLRGIAYAEQWEFKPLADLLFWT